MKNYSPLRIIININIFLSIALSISLLLIDSINIFVKIIFLISSLAIALFYFADRIIQKNKGGLDVESKINQIIDQLTEAYGYKLLCEISYIHRIMRNKMLFDVLNIELMISPFKFKEMIYTRGWRKTFKSSRKALEKIRIIHNDNYEGIFIYSITLLITFYAILRDFYSQRKEKFNKLKAQNPEISAGLLIKEYDEFNEAILIKEDDLKPSELEKKYFNMDSFRKNAPNEKSVLSFKNKFLEALEKVSNVEDIKRALERLDSEHWRDMKIYSSFFKHCLYQTKIDNKLNFLKEQGFDFSPWCDKLYRNKNTHHLNVIFIKDETGLCAIKIIKGNFRNKIININELYEAHGKLFALSDFIFGMLQNWGINLPLIGCTKLYLSINRLKKSLEDSKITFPN